MDSAPFLFVYGTLRRPSADPMRVVLERYARWAGPGSFTGLLFDLGEYPGAVPDPSGTCRVVGELYRIGDPGRLLPLLDEYEGCGPEERAPEYRRELCDATTAAGESVRAWIYLYDRPVGGYARIVSGDYLQRTGA